MFSYRTVQLCISVLAAIWGTIVAPMPANDLGSAGIQSGVALVDAERHIDLVDDAENAMPGNPMVALPNNVDAEIPDDATVVSGDLAVTASGDVLNLATGESVNDVEIVGSEQIQPDPLEKTDGQSFIPVGVSEVREAVSHRNEDESISMNTSGHAYAAALTNNEYGAYWGVYNGTPAFYEANGTMFAQQAKGVIDVSEWQGTIDWDTVKKAGVEGAVIRISYGWNNGFDAQAKRNIRECQRLGIPFGIYMYSYAYDNVSAASEGDDIVALLRDAGVAPDDLSYPVFYDLEQWTWTGHTPPTSPNVYDGIVNTWYSKLQTAGYTNLSVYSYASYLNSQLNSANIHNKTRWVASYGPRVRFQFVNNERAWQYTSSGSIAGIEGRVDLNAFGNLTYVDNGSWGLPIDIMGAQGTNFYFANSLSGGVADKHIIYGRTGDVVLVGDWDGDSVSTLAVRRGCAYHVKNSISGGVADAVVYYGREGDEVLVGDWDGDGVDTLAVRRGRTYYIKNSISGGDADIVVVYGRESDEVLVGDWDGDGVDTLAVRRGRTYYVKNSISGGEADRVISYGREDDSVLVGDWDGDGDDTFAVRRGRMYYVVNEIRGGEADVYFAYGRENDDVLVGDWDGDGHDTFCVRR